MFLQVIAHNDMVLNYGIGQAKITAGKPYIMHQSWVSNLDGDIQPCNLSPYTLETDATDKSILFIRSMGRGDILIMSPLIQALKEKYPTCKIGFACIKEHQDILEIVPGIDEIITLPIEAESFYKYNHYFQVADLVERNLADSNRNIYEIYAEQLGLTFEERFGHPYVKDSVLKDVVVKEKLIGIHPFSGDNIRMISPYIINYLCEKLIANGYDIVMFSNQKEMDDYNGLFNGKIKWAIRSINNMKSTARLLASCNVVISTDSIITHLAQAVGTKTICIYGPFPSESRVKYYKNISIIDTNPNCRCMQHQNGCTKKFRLSPCLYVDPDLILGLIDGRSRLALDIQNVEVTKYNFGIVHKDIDNHTSLVDFTTSGNTEGVSHTSEEGVGNEDGEVG